tara:strand:+ start:5210 stop:6697 length:1488 start_codon:yes stop_codon:yes gene_type:complete
MATLMPTKGDITEIGFGILAIRETTQGIRKALGKEIKRDKKATKKKEGFLRRLFTKKKKAESEKLIEAKKPKNLIGKGVGAVAAAGKSFMERILGAAGALLVGFLVVNIPKIIEEIQKIVGWLKNVKEWVDNIIDKVKAVSSVIIKTVKDWISGIKKQFGFEEEKDEVEKQMDELNKSVETLSKDWNADQERLKKDIEKAEKEGRASVEGLPKNDQEFTEVSNVRQNKVIELQQKRDSGEIDEKQYEIEVNKVYEINKNENNKDQQILKNQIDRNTMSPAEFFGTNEFSDSEEIDTDIKPIDLNTNNNSNESEIKLDNKIVPVEVEKVDNSDTDKEIVVNKTKKKRSNIYRKSSATARFTPPGFGYDGYSKEEAKEEFLALHQNDSRSTTQNFDYQQLEVLLHDKFKVNTDAIQVEGADAIKFLKGMKYADEMNLIGPTGGRIVTVPIDIPKKEINTGGPNNLGELDVDNESSSSVVVVAENPIKKINQFNKHFS